MHSGTVLTGIDKLTSIDRLNGEINTVLTDSNMKARIADLGAHRPNAVDFPQLPRIDRLRRPELLHPDISRSDYLAPRLDLKLNLLGELLWSTADGIKAKCNQAFVHIRLCNRTNNLSI
jgi:hypothetical protein